MTIFTVCVAVLAVCAFTATLPFTRQESTAETNVLLGRLLASLTRSAEFFLSDYQNVNIDGVFAARLCQGSLLGALHDCELKGYHCPEELKLNISTINELLNDVSEKAIPFVKEDDEEYYGVFVGIIEAPFKVKYINEPIVNSTEETDIAEDYNGATGDLCFTSIMGTYKNDSRVFPKCTISDECFRYMTRMAANEYYLTHQLLYTMFAQQVGCDQVLERRLLRDMKISLRDHQRNLCQQIYLEASSLEHNGTVFTPRQDLFFEQIGLCGALGFQNVLKDDWLSMVLDWQMASGCFSNNFSQAATVPPEQSTVDLQDGHSGEIKGIVKRAKSRRKRNEHKMTSGCLSHKTGVALVTMGAYVRHLVTELHSDKSQIT